MSDLLHVTIHMRSGKSIEVDYVEDILFRIDTLMLKCSDRTTKFVFLPMVKFEEIEAVSYVKAEPTK